MYTDLMQRALRLIERCPASVWWIVGAVFAPTWLSLVALVVVGWFAWCLGLPGVEIALEFLVDEGDLIVLQQTKGVLTGVWIVVIAAVLNLPNLLPDQPVDTLIGYNVRCIQEPISYPILALLRWLRPKFEIRRGWPGTPDQYLRLPLPAQTLVQRGHIQGLHPKLE